MAKEHILNYRFVIDGLMQYGLHEDITLIWNVTDWGV